MRECTEEVVQVQSSSTQRMNVLGRAFLLPYHDLSAVGPLTLSVRFIVGLYAFSSARPLRIGGWAVCGRYATEGRQALIWDWGFAVKEAAVVMKRRKAWWRGIEK